MKSILRLLVVSLILSPLGFAAPLGTPLPRSTPEAEGISSAGISALVDELEAKAYGVHSIMIVRHGRVVAEGWWGPYTAEEPHMLFSLSKSFTSTAIGLLQSEGKLDIHDPLLKYFPGEAPANASDNLKTMRIRDLLMMSTGQHKEEVDRLNEGLTAKPDATKQFLAMPVPHKPGTLFYYNSPGTYMLSATVTKVTGQTVRDYLMPRIFEPLGIPAPDWDISVQGYSHGASGLHLRTEEIAKFGQLLLQRGEWNGRRLIPAAWIDLATSRQTSNGSDPDGEWDQGYGFQFWRCVPGFYRADGAHGQFCIVMPQYDTVIAINSGTPDMRGVLKTLWSRLLPELRPAALPADDVAAGKLKAKLSTLIQPVVAGANTNATAALVSGKTFHFADNPLKLESLNAKFEAGAAKFVLKVDGKEYVLSAVAGVWTKGETYPAVEAKTPAPAATTGAWTADETYTLVISEYLNTFKATYTLRFQNGELTLERRVNTGIAAKEPVLLTGKS